MSKEQLAHPRLSVTKFDTTEGWRPGLPARYHFEVRSHDLHQTAGFLVIRHWLETAQVEVDDMELHDPETAHRVGVHVLRACGRDLRLQAIAELRFAEPLQAEIKMARDAFGADALQVSHAMTDEDVRHPYPRTLDELIAQAPQEFAPIIEDEQIDMWIDLRAQNMTGWPDCVRVT